MVQLHKSAIIIFFGIILTILFLPKISSAATINAVSCEQADVQAAITSASSGDMVVIPAGNCVWSSTVNVTKGIIIKGSGSDTTTLTANEVCLFSIILTNNADFRITDLGFAGTGRSCGGLEGQLIRISGNSSTIWNFFRADHLKFTNTNRHAITIDPWWNIPSHPKALFDHITFSSNVPGSRFIKIAGNNNTWQYDDLYGTDWAIFIENSTFTWMGVTGEVSDTEHGVRLVFRYNTIMNGSVQMHDTGGTPAAKGQRITEIYNNIFTCDSPNCSSTIPMGIRGGGYIIYDNIISSTGYFAAAWPQIWRSSVGAGFLGGMCNGSAVPACYTSTFYHCSSGDHAVCSYPGDFACNGKGTCVVAASNQDDCPIGFAFLSTVDNVDGGNDPSGWPCRNQTGWGMESTDGRTEQPSPVYWYNNKDQNGTIRYLPNDVSIAYFQQDRDYCYHDTSTTCGTKAGWIYTPYSYPHPLAVEASPPPPDTTPPAPPTNLTIQ